MKADVKFNHDDKDEFCVLPSGLRLCYRTYGPSAGAPMLLVVGLGLQLIYWPKALIALLVKQGFKVIVFDNRDVGLSSRIASRPPSLLSQAFRRVDKECYELADMARDAVGLMDHLGHGQFHLVGMSMGGMIAQVMAARYPGRVISLTSIFSTTGSPKVGQPATSSILRMLKAPPRTVEDAMERFVSMLGHIGATRFEMPEQALRQYARAAWLRGEGAQAHEGVARQIGAIIKSGDRTKELTSITTPTLVIHGDVDLMVAPSGGLATATVIRGAQFVTLPGLGHCMPEEASPLFADLIVGHATRAEDVSRPQRLTALFG